MSTNPFIILTYLSLFITFDGKVPGSFIMIVGRVMVCIIIPRNLKIPLLSVILLMMASLSPVMAAEEMDQSPVAGNLGEKTSNPGAWMVSIYRNYISPVDGDRCPSYPTCAAYSMMAIKKHGFFIGWLMTVDRLIHEGREETRVSPMTFSGGRWRIYDPVENNDFWWDPLKGHESQ